MNAWHGGLGLGMLAALWAAASLLAAPEPPPAATVGAPRDRAAVATPLALPTARPARAVPVVPPRPAATAAAIPGELDRLVVEARRGDMRAAYAAWQILSACAAPDGPGCPGLPASLVQERLRFLDNAARAGLPAAQVDFYMQGPDPQQALDADALQAWRERALAGLKSAAVQCEPFAMGLLATLFDAGELMPRDATQAVAYAVAESQLRRRVASDASLRDRLAEPVSDEVLAAGRQLGLRQASACP